MRSGTALLAVAVTFALAACSQPTSSPTASTPSATPSAARSALPSPVATTLPAQPRVATDPAQLADELIADEQTLRDPSASESALTDAARRQQVAYRTLGRNPEAEAIARPRIPAPLLDIYDYNIDARHQLDALLESPKDTLPEWRIDAPAPADELLGYYREAESASGVGWNFLAAINLIETRFGRVVGLSSAGAQGPMQFLPSTFAAYGGGGDILSPRDSIMAAGRLLAANGFAQDPDGALFGYNNSDYYVRAVTDYAAVLATGPSAFAGYYRWDVYYYTTAGDVLLPIGYVATSPIPVADYLATHPQ